MKEELTIEKQIKIFEAMLKRKDCVMSVLNPKIKKELEELKKNQAENE